MPDRCCHRPKKVGDIIVFAQEAGRNAHHDCYSLYCLEKFGRLPTPPCLRLGNVGGQHCTLCFRDGEFFQPLCEGADSQGARHVVNQPLIGCGGKGE